MPEFEKEFRQEIEVKISRCVDNLATIHELLLRFDFEELEKRFGSLEKALYYRKLWKNERDFYKKVYRNLWQEDYDPPVGWME